MNNMENFGIAVLLTVFLITFSGITAIPWLAERNTTINIEEVNRVKVVCDNNGGVDRLTQDTRSYTIECKNSANFYVEKRDANTN